MKRRVRAEAGTILLPYWLRWAIYAVTAILAMTGILWLISHYGLKGTADDLPHPIETWMMRLHGFAVMPALFLYGSLLRSHMIKAWNARMNRATGFATVLILALLTLSGYLLYYAGDERLRPIISICHWGFGSVFIAALPLHIVMGRRKFRGTAHKQSAMRHLPTAVIGAPGEMLPKQKTLSRRRSNSSGS